MTVASIVCRNCREEAVTANEHLKAILDALPKSEFWTPKLWKAEKEARDFLAKRKTK